MLAILDFFVYVIYTGYQKREFETRWKQMAYESLWAYQVGRAEQTRSALAWAMSLILGMFLNYMVIDHWKQYRDCINENNVLFFVFPGVCVLIIYNVFARHYTDKKILELASRYKSSVSIRFGKFVLVLTFLFAFTMMFSLFIFTAYALAKD